MNSTILLYFVGMRFFTVLWVCWYVLQNEKLSAGSAFSDTSETVKTQTLPGLCPWTPLGGLQHAPIPPSCFITCFASESACYAPLSRIYLMSTLMSVFQQILIVYKTFTLRIETKNLPRMTRFVLWSSYKGVL